MSAAYGSWRGREISRKSCPDCGHEGPHDVQLYMGDREMACTNCGMQHILKPGEWEEVEL